MYYWRLGVRHVREHPLTWMHYNARRLEITWWHETELLFWANVSWSYGADWIWRAIVVVAIIGAIAALAGRVPRRQWLPVLAMVATAVVLTTPFVPQPRRHFPLVAPVALLAGLGSQALYVEALRARGRLEERRARRSCSSGF
jgi:hypothetical protein